MGPRLELMDFKDRIGATCARCGETRSVKYRIGGKTFCNRCAPIVQFNSNEQDTEYDDNFTLNSYIDEEDN